MPHLKSAAGVLGHLRAVMAARDHWLFATDNTGMAGFVGFESSLTAHHKVPPEDLLFGTFGFPDPATGGWGPLAVLSCPKALCPCQLVDGLLRRMHWVEAVQRDIIVITANRVRLGLLLLLARDGVLTEAAIDPA